MAPGRDAWPFASAALAVLLAGCLAPGAPEPPSEQGVPAREPFPGGTAPGATRLFARIGEPGDPEGIVVDEGRLHVTVSASDGSRRPEVWSLDLRSGALDRRWALASGEEGRALGVAVDQAGRLYVADPARARVLRLDLAREPPEETTYATLPDLPACVDAPLQSPCEPKLGDALPAPNFVAFDREGRLYVSDISQATVFRVPTGGGEALAWFGDARFGAAGPNGLAISPDGAHLYVAHTTVGPLTRSTAALSRGGAVWRLPLVDAPAASDLDLVRPYRGALIDGLAFGASGRLYVTHGALEEGVRDGISVLDPSGEEVAFYPAPGGEAEVPYDFPANLAFHDAHRSLLVTNQAFGTPEHWAVLETFVDDAGVPLHRPG